MLPKLAVSAKLIFCLLMVVMCGAGAPSMVRSVRLYNQCSSYEMRVEPSGRVFANAHDERYINLTIRSVDFKGKLAIYADEAKQYLCFTQRWKLVGSKKFKGPMCVFKEEYDLGYSRFRSVGNESYYIGFNKKGKPLRGIQLLEVAQKRTGCRWRSFNFLKFDKNFGSQSIGEHNALLGGRSNQPRPIIRHHNHHRGPR